MNIKKRLSHRIVRRKRDYAINLILPVKDTTFLVEETIYFTMMLKADLHSHTRFSYDSATTVDQLIHRCQKVGITCLAVTDHHSIEGALRVAEKAPFKVIIGEEIFSQGGELIGLFLKERIPPGLPFDETIHRIKDQGGLVYLPHPVSGIRHSKLSLETVTKYAHLIDIVERYNSRTLFQKESDFDWVTELTNRHNWVVAAASDAHSVFEFGNVLITMQPFETPQQFLSSLSEATISFKKSPLWIRIFLNHKVRKWMRRNLPNDR